MAHLRYLAFQILLLCGCSIQDPVYTTKFDLGYSLHECETRFLSVGLEPSRSIVYISMFSSEKLLRLAKELAPGEIRLGGTSANFLCFAPDGTECGPQNSDNAYAAGSADFQKITRHDRFTMTGDQWDNFTSFVDRAGLELLLDFNVFRRTRNNVWDPTNAELLLNYSSAKGVRIPVFQLGNEPNSNFHRFKFEVSPETLVKDLRILKNVIAKYPKYASSKLCGPDVTQRDIRYRVPYLKRFLVAKAYEVVDEISLHHYYLSGNGATEQDFLSVSVLESFRTLLNLTQNLVQSSSRPMKIRLTETSSADGGGARDLSNSYIAGFLWLDKLGIAAQYGITRVVRNTLFGGTYELVTARVQPNPDYYLSVLFKRLIEGPVFKVSIEPSNEKLRVYANCARKGLYSPGALVVYFLNLDTKDTVLSLFPFQDADHDLYMLTPAYSIGMKSIGVKLNGKTLSMSGLNVPSMPPKSHKGNVILKAQTFGFIVIPSANVDLCVKYYAKSE